MKIFDFSEKVGKQLQHFNLIHNVENIKPKRKCTYWCYAFKREWNNGYHEAVVSQLLLLWTEKDMYAANKEKVKVEAGQAVFGKRGSFMRQVQNMD